MNHGDSGLAATRHHVDVLCRASVQQTVEVDWGNAEGTNRRRCEIDHGGTQRRDLTAIFGMHVGRRGVKDEVDRGLVEPSHQTINALGRCFESNSRARWIPADSSIPTIQVASINSLRWHFINRSVPIFPGPMIAAFTFTVAYITLFIESAAYAAVVEAFARHNQMHFIACLYGLQRHDRPERITSPASSAMP